MPLKYKFLWLCLCSLTGVGAIIVMFRISEDTTHYHNRFVRRFPQHVAEKIAQANLEFNSYYFAGYSNGQLYLGNTTAPLQVMAWDAGLKKRTVHHIELIEKDLPFQSPRIRVDGNQFYVYEGSAPYIYRGTTKVWKAKRILQGGHYFSQLEPLDPEQLALRYVKDNGESLIGIVNLSDTTDVTYGPAVLQKQFDGIFDTDGSLHTDTGKKRLLYVYRYRNQYILANDQAKVLYRGNTIDTISTAQIEITEVPGHKKKTFSKPPLIVNKSSAYFNGLLFVNSLLPGRYEDDDLWKTSSIVDVYDVASRTYRSSFTVADAGGKKMRSMFVVEGKLYALINNQLDCYRLREHLTQSRAASASQP